MVKFVCLLWIVLTWLIVLVWLARYEFTCLVLWVWLYFLVYSWLLSVLISVGYDCAWCLVAVRFVFIWCSTRF